MKFVSKDSIIDLWISNKASTFKMNWLPDLSDDCIKYSVNS